MSGKYYGAYLNGVAQTPDQSYKSMAQQTIISQWINTTQLKTIKEQTYPFVDKYTEYEAWINTVSDVTTNTNKNTVDFISVLYKDINHVLNHRGQKYLYKPDDVNENIYLCYDKMNSLTVVPDFSCVRCNNHLTWLDSNGAILTEPCYIGEEITSTNNQVSKDTTIPQRRLVCMIQGNSNTSSIKLNQRFILSHRQAFKITEMNVSTQDDWVTQDVPLYTFYIEWTPLQETDNTELNLANYYTSNYVLKIDQQDLSLQQNANGQLTTTITLNGSVVSIPVTWSSSNTNIVTIDSSGNYTVKGNVGNTCSITCSATGNDQVTDSITISIVSAPSSEKVLTVMPNTVDSIKVGYTKSLYYGVYINGELQSDVVTYSASGADASCYTITSVSGGIDIKCIKVSSTPITVTFTSGTLTKTMTIKLVGLL